MSIQHLNIDPEILAKLDADVDGAMLERDPMYRLHKSITSHLKDGKINNVYRTNEYEHRCVVVKPDADGIDQVVPPVQNEDGSTYQLVEEGAKIFWIGMDNTTGVRGVFVQTGEGIDNSELRHDAGINGDYNGKYSAFIYSFLADFGFSTALGGQEEMDEMEKLKEAIADLVTDTNTPVAQLLIALLNDVDDPISKLPTWEHAKELKGKVKDISYGVNAETDEKDYIKYINTRLVYWYQPYVENESGEKVLDDSIHVSTRHIQSEHLPHLAPEAVAEYRITEALDENIKGVLIIETDVLTGKLHNLSLFSRDKFAPNKK